MIFKTRRKSAFVDVDMLIITSESIKVLDHTVQLVNIIFTLISARGSM